MTATAGVLGTAPPLRVGLLLDSPLVSKYVQDFVVWSQASATVRVTHLIVHSPQRGAAPKGVLFRLLKFIKRNGVSATLSSILFHGLIRLEQFLLKMYVRHANHLDRFDLSSLVSHSIGIVPMVSRSGFVYTFDQREVERVKELGLDVLIRCGHAILRGGILEAAQFGILSFHHADNRVNRGGPAGFWEVNLRHDTTGFTIQRLTDELDGGDVLMRGHLATRYFYLLNQASLCEKSNYYLKLVVERIALSGRLPPILPAVPYSNRLFRAPGGFDIAVYLFRLLRALGAKVIDSWLDIRARFSVAYVPGGWNTAVLWRGVQLTNPPRHFLADPFVTRRDGKDYCFVEDYDFDRRRGSIAVYQIGGGSGRRLGLALEQDFHVSFPYLFEYRGELYMCPETAANRDIRIYRCQDFPLRWTLERVIMQNISAVDTMILEWGGKWWMFANVDPIQAHDQSPHEIDDHSTLFIYSASSPLEVDWTPHAQNPIMVDASCARNAGLLADGNRLFRVAQAQGFDTYGQKSLISEITKLDDTSYAETVFCELTPSFLAHIRGIHHFHSNGHATVFDILKKARIR